MRKKLLAMLALMMSLTISVGLTGCMGGSTSSSDSSITSENSSSADESSNGGSSDDTSSDDASSDNASSDDASSDNASSDDASSDNASSDDDSSDDPVKATYSVSFDSAGGSTVETQTIEEGNVASEPTAPTKDGYTFAGWTLNGAAYDFATIVTGNIELVATWTKNIVYYTVSFNVDGGSAVADQTIAENEVASEPTAPTKEDYKFGGWLLNGEVYDFATPVTGNVELTAKWIAGYAVTFNSNGGSAVLAQDVDEGQCASKPSDPTKVGYTFASWALNGETYDFTTPITGDIELVAVWTPNEDTAYKLVVYAEKLDGTYEELTSYDKTGTTDGQVSLGEEDLALIPTGFTFDDDNEGNVISGTVLADGSLVLKAYINRVSYDVKYYDYNGELIYTESVRYEASAIYGEEPIRETDSDGMYSFNTWVTEMGGSTAADLSSVKGETEVYASYNVKGFIGVYATVEELTQSNVWGNGNTTLSVSNEVTYNGESSLKMVSGGSPQGFGVFLPDQLLRTLLEQANVKGVKLSFDYMLEASANINYAAIGWAGEESKNTGRTGSEGNWQRFETILTDVPSNFSISFSDNSTLAWANEVSGTVYIANVRYEAVDDLSKGTLIDTARADAIEYISTDVTFGSWTMDTTVKFNGKDTMKYEAMTNTNAQNQNRLYSIEAVVANLLAQENVVGVRVSTNYMFTENNGMAFIGMSIDQDVDGNWTSSQVIGALNVWNSLSTVFTAEMDQAILHIAPNQGGGWAGSGYGTATVYFSDFTYELIYANTKTTYSNGSSTYKWVGDVGMSSAEQYNGMNSITITDGGAWSMGVFLDNNQLRQLLALPNATSVNVSFKYKAGTLSDNVYYVGFHGGDTFIIDRTEGWHEVTTKLTALPENFIIGAGVASGLTWQNAAINGTMYIADITFTVNYNEGAKVSGSTVAWQDPASVTTSTEYAYGEQENSTEVGFRVGYNYANIIVTMTKYEGSGYIEFYFKNTTGVAMEIYTPESLEENGDVTGISADSEWQFIRLAVSKETDTYTIIIRTKDGATFEEVK